MYGEYFYGNKISDYGLEHGRVDYRTFAKAFDAVMANDLMNATADIGFWEPITDCSYYEDDEGNTYDYESAQEKIEELRAQLEILQASSEPDENEISEIESNINALEYEHYYDVFQWYIVAERGARICKEYGEILFYNETLDLYLWGVTHYGTSWDYVLTDIPCNTGTID